MRIVRSLLVLALLVGLTAPLPVFAAKRNALQQPKKKKHHHGISGTVVSVHHNKEQKGTGSIKVRVYPHQRKPGRNNNNNAANKQANNKPQANNKIAKAAVAQPKKQQPHTVKVHVHPHTKFAVVGKGLVPGKPQTKTVGSGKNKTKILVPGKPKMATLKIPAQFRHVKPGQHVHVHLAGDGHHNAKEVHIHPQKSQQQQQANKPQPKNP
jgi:hypothetical protein